MRLTEELRCRNLRRTPMTRELIAFVSWAWYIENRLWFDMWSIYVGMLLDDWSQSIRKKLLADEDF